LGSIVNFGLSVTILKNLDKAEPNATEMKNAGIGICVMGALTLIYAALFSLPKKEEKKE
jgi:hypothetical protein